MGDEASNNNRTSPPKIRLRLIVLVVVLRRAVGVVLDASGTILCQCWPPLVMLQNRLVEEGIKIALVHFAKWIRALEELDTTVVLL